MTATEELRRLLDERGVEWWPEKYYKDACTVWRAKGMEWRASEQTDGRLLVGCTSLAHLTPEQAIAATVGRGTCQVETTENWLPAERYHRCKHCGAFFAVLDASGDIPPRFCPNCGRKVVEDGD